MTEKLHFSVGNFYCSLILQKNQGKLQDFFEIPAILYQKSFSGLWKRSFDYKWPLNCILARPLPAVLEDLDVITCKN